MNRFSWLENAGALGYPTAIMKRIVLALALAVALAPAPARGQASVISQIAGDKAATDKLYFGLKAGMSCGRLKGFEGAERRGGPHVGLQATIALGDRLSLVPEVTFVSPKGITAIPFFTTGDPGLDPFFADPDRSALMLSYVDVPVQVRYRLGRFHIGAGGFVGFLVSARETLSGGAPGGRGPALREGRRRRLPETRLRAALRGVLDDHQAAPRLGTRLPPPLAGGAGRYPPGIFGAARLLAPRAGPDVWRTGFSDFSVHPLKGTREVRHAQ